MITLLTRDSTKTGNAIIYGQEMTDYGTEVFLVETDFGNRMRLIRDEVNSMFMIGRLCSYAEWRADRFALQNQEPPKDSSSDLPGGVIPIGSVCSVCNEEQFTSPSGVTCVNGHGGATGFRPYLRPIED